MHEQQMRFPLKSLLILILTINLCFLLVALTRLNFEAIPNVDIKQIGIENQRILKQNTAKLDRIMEFIDREKANGRGHKAEAQ